jgi:hypothetical protein
MSENLKLWGTEAQTHVRCVRGVINDKEHWLLDHPCLLLSDYDHNHNGPHQNKSTCWIWIICNIQGAYLQLNVVRFTTTYAISAYHQ